MQICSDGHDEVCYEDRDSWGRPASCPVCVALKERDEVWTERDQALERIKELLAELADAKAGRE
jgi:hypothetical protein